MSRHILLIEGHPDAARRHLNHVLADAYCQGAVEAGHSVRRLWVAELDFALLRSQREWESTPVPLGLRQAQADIAWAQHLVLLFPLWLGDMPALLKGFLEQVARPDFAFKPDPAQPGNPFAAKGLSGRSARVVVTMGMPAALYRWFYRAHSVKSLERNILGFVGIAPVNSTLVGQVDKLGSAGVARWERRLRQLGRDAV
ncbi:NAD(P)H-dependent oxidoreductase [Hydrogenophaga soli]